MSEDENVPVDEWQCDRCGEWFPELGHYDDPDIWWCNYCITTIDIPNVPLLTWGAYREAHPTASYDEYSDYLTASYLEATRPDRPEDI